MAKKTCSDVDTVFTMRIKKKDRELYQDAAEIDGFRELAPWIRRTLSREARAMIERKGASDGR